jgi:elongation factor G
MKTYQGSEIRNVAVMGHAHSGKTTLIAALLHAAKMTPTQGRVADGTAVTAYDEEEVARGVTMQNAVAFAEWQGVKINFVDTPGFHMFSHEARAALLPVETAVVLVNAQNGVEAVTERVWRYAEEASVPRIVVVNQMDHPKAGGGGGLSALVEDLVDRWGRNCVPVQLPISDSEGFHGVVDLVTMDAFYYTPGGDGRGKITAEIPASLAADAKARHEALVELVAEGKDELMEEYFDKGTILEEHLIAALHEAIREDRIFPVLFTSGVANMATDHLLDFTYAPSPIERTPCAVHAPEPEAAAANASPAAEADAGISFRKVADSEPAGLVVFKTMTDPFSGRVTFFKVISGVIKNDVTLENYTRRTQEKMSHLSVMQGRKAVEVPELHAGDLGAVAKLRETLTGDTLGQKGAEMQVDIPAFPEPAMTYAIEPKSRADEDKLAPAIHKLMEEDRLIRFFRDPMTTSSSSPAPASPTLKPSSAGSKNAITPRSRSKRPKCPTAKPSAPRSRRRGVTKSRPAATANSATARFAWSPCPAAAASSLPAKSSAAPSPATSSPPLKRASSSRLRAAFSPASRSSTSGPSSTTAVTTTWTPTKCPSRWPAASPSARLWKRRSPACSSPS